MLINAKPSLLVAETIAAGILSSVLTVSAGELNVKPTDRAPTAVVAGSPATPMTPPANSSIKVERLKSMESQTPYPVLKDDLVNAGAHSLLKASFDDFAPHQASNAATLNDGEAGKPTDNASVAFDLDGKWKTTFVLDTAKAAKGYEISEIRTTAGWLPNRACQKYELLIAKVGAPDRFVSMGIFELDAEKALGTQLKLTGAQGPLASNVAALKFVFTVPESADGSATETTYREVDVIGAASEK